eukprot:7385121-Prymnesium_polylepis.1
MQPTLPLQLVPNEGRPTERLSFAKGRRPSNGETGPPAGTGERVGVRMGEHAPTPMPKPSEVATAPGCPLRVMASPMPRS